ncbi:hypothetical protein [Flavobacterium chungbukense]|uniref:Competence protein CoiA-like protein n=1 Tax=Flavobacterium chungbukense TaxID=877464 RepID=A0ABP7YVJ1_9FLAO|nr:hypothetical protein [Flavobacterium chungbukense]MCC4923258.1 hypothetical protein [Flavobacterium chungbukense]
MSKVNPKEENEYAKNIKDEVVYIGDAISGRKGYWCLGCNEEMDAVKKKNIYHKSYFRHSAKGVDNERKCTFSNQEYRHKLAIEILQFTKRIKVPNLYSYSPDGKKAVLLEEAQFIEAHHVRAELTFYEDDEGKIVHGKNPDIENKNLLIRPDLTFFNSKDEPILLIEIVVSHKLDDEKKVKLKRLGIDTIQIIIPKDSEENIAKSLLTSNNTKWVYNYVQERTDYIQVSKGDREELSSIDELQRKFFGESVVCRTNQISNLIRSIKNSLGTQLYRRIEQQFESELSRVKANTKRNRERLEELEREFEDEVYSSIRHEEEEVEQRSRDLEQQQIAFEENHSDLERRYIKRREYITKEEANTEREIKFRYRVGESEEDIRRDFGLEETRIDNEQSKIRREERYIEVNFREESRFALNFERENRKIEREFEELEKREREDFEKLRKGLQSKDGEYRELKAEVENGLRSEFEREYEQIVDRVNQRDIQSNDELSERIKSILEIRGLLDNYENEISTIGQYQKYLEFVRTGAWKKW